MPGSRSDSVFEAAFRKHAPRMIRTKIVATLGPAVGEGRLINALLVAGVDVCRLNFSHGTLAEHARMLQMVREQAGALGLPVAVLGDLGGPKIRLGDVADVGGTGGMPIETGEELIFQREPILGSGGIVSSTYPGIVDDVQVGHRVLIEDGLLRFVCTAKEHGRLHLRCSSGGVLKTRKGINLPNTSVKLPSITDRDWECVEWAIANELDYVALSFVRRAEEVKQLRDHLASRNSQAHVIAKIEKVEALADIDRIVSAADGLMVARGDLGVEVDLAQVPIIQKDLVRRCRRAGKPVIVATQMLQSMVENSSPTRAEVSDVANAIWDRADALMLSGETSVGRYPVGAVHTMAHVAGVTERYLEELAMPAPPAPTESEPAPEALRLSAAAAQAVRRLVQELDCRLVVVYSQSGETVRLFANQRFPIPLLGLSNDICTLRKINLHYGVLPMHMPMPMPENPRQLVAQVDVFAQEREMASPGDRIVLVAGRALGGPGSMNGILIHTVGTPQEAP